MSYKYKVSVIIPVYNVQDTLEKCVNSAVKQDLEQQDYEIILINDGSTDRSLEIAEEMSKRYDNVSLISQENQGLSGARNTGLNYCSGEYVTFLDSDDAFALNQLGSIYKVCKENDLDVCRLKKCYINKDGKKIRCDTFKGVLLDHIYTGEEAYLFLVGSVCASFFKVSIIKDNKLEFYRGLTQEDVEFSTRFLTHVHKAMVLDKVLYYCLINYNSLSRDKSFDKQNRYVCDTAKVISLSKAYAQSDHVSDTYRKLITKRSNSAIIGVMINFMKKNTIPLEIVKNFINYSKELGVLPLKGGTLSFQSKLFMPIANNKKLYFFIYNLYKKYLRYKH